MKAFFLLMAVLGAVIPWVFNVMALQEIGAGYTPAAFFLQGFEGSAMLGSLSADFWLGSTASLVWMVAEARRIGLRHWWILIVITFAIAWACALPLFFYLRERHLEREAEPETRRPGEPA